MLRKLYQIPIYGLILLFILFEDLIWNRIAKPIASFFIKIDAFKILAKIITALNKYVVLIIFLAIFIYSEFLTPISLGLIGNGMIIQGILVYLAKIPLASFSFWIFRLTEDELRTIKWFDYLYSKLQQFIAFVKNTKYFKNVKEFYLNAKEKMKDFFKSEKEFFLVKFVKRVYQKAR